MAKLLKLRRGTTSQHSSFTGAEGEVTVDTTKDTLVVHDGSTAGGVPLAKESDNLSLIDEDNMATDSNSRPPSQQSVKAYVDGKVPTTITVADESSDTTCFPLFVTAATGDLAPKTGTNFTFNSSTGKVIIGGDLQVQGTTTTVDSTTMTVADKNIEIAKGAANDAAADGAGITVDSGDGDKTWNWVDATDAWTSSEHIHLGDDKKLLVGTGSDIEIYHDGSNSYIKESGTGSLKIGSSSLWLQTANYSESMASFTPNGSVDLYHDNIKTFSTDAYGAVVYGPEGYGAHLYLYADEGDDNADKWALLANAAGTFSIRSYSTGSWVDSITISGSGNITGVGTISGSKGDLRSIPANGQGGNYTLALSDLGKYVKLTGSGTVTIDNSIFSQGHVVTILNLHSGDITIAQGSGVTLTNTADAATGNRTLASKGMATVLFDSASSCYISGSGLS